VSENRSADIAEEALGTGASGYDVKSDVRALLSDCPSLHSLPPETLLRIKRHANMNSGSTHRFGFNGNLSIRQPKLAHAGETETSTLHCRFQIEPSPQITDEEMNLT
jgi:hypothetical protein